MISYFFTHRAHQIIPILPKVFLKPRYNLLMNHYSHSMHYLLYFKFLSMYLCIYPICYWIIL